MNMLIHADVSMHTYAYMHTYTQVHIYTHAQTHVHTQTHMHTHTHSTHTCAHIHTCMHMDNYFCQLYIVNVCLPHQPPKLLKYMAQASTSESSSFTPAPHRVGTQEQMSEERVSVIFTVHIIS
jgi:hypothetical protein